MSKTVIAAEGLGKSYMIGHQQRDSYSTLRDALTSLPGQWWSRFRNPQYHTHENLEEFWALKDVNFEIKQGDRVGIIGRNGAGKSTLLKILSRITEPTTGRARIAGRVASLLEVGTGFHPELTGRENIFLNGAILGMGRREIKKKFDEIVFFAEIEKFLDTPVKRYSSGMYVRLAFAVAAHLAPQIMIVDEVLAVGDAQFQKKCLGKMEAVGQEGRTILFVSHNMGAVNAICNKGILLQNGRVAASGSIDSVLAKYMQRSSIGDGHKFVNKTPVGPNVKARILDAIVLDQKGEPNFTVFIDQVCFIQITWRLNVRVPFLRVGLEIINSFGVVVVSSMDTDATDLHGKPREPGIFHETMKLPPFLLMPGHYSVRVFVGIPGIERIVELDNMLEYEVVDNHTHLSHVGGAIRSGYVAMPLQWEVNFIHADQGC